MDKELLIFLVNIIISVASLIAIIILIKIIFRTEKELDLGFKYIIVAPIATGLASLFYIDKAFLISGINYPDTLFFASRIIALIFFTVGVYKILKVVSKVERCDCVREK